MRQAPQVERAVARARESRRRMLARGRWLLVVYILALVVVIALAVAARNFTLLPGDLPFTRELQEHRSPFIFWLFYLVSALGFALPAVATELLALVILWALRLRLEALFLVLALLADLLGGVLKIVVGRTRPTPDLVHVVQQIQQPSFPSGHTLHYTVFYGFLIVVLVTNFKASWLRNTLVLLFALVILLVGPSRIYLGEHWPTDVLGGYLIGGLFLVPLVAGYLWAKARLVVIASPPWLRRIPPAAQGDARK